MALLTTFNNHRRLKACSQGGRVTIGSGLTLAGGQKIARVNQHNFRGRVTLTSRDKLMCGYTKRFWKQLGSKPG